MALLQHFLLGFVASFIGSLPFGVINLTSIDIAVNKNLKSVIRFSIAASIIEFLYALFAIYLIEWLVVRNNITYYINVALIPVFLIIAFTYFRKDGLIRHGRKLPKQMSSFYKGLLLGLVNPLCIPFWIFYASYFLSFGWIELTNLKIFTMVSGISLGTFAVLLLYGYIGQNIVKRIDFLNVWLNRIIGSTLAILAIIQAIRIFN